MGREKPKGPPESALKWMREREQGLHQGLAPTPEHENSIWDTSYIPERFAAATPQLIAEAEARLGVTIPESMRRNLLIQNGGCLPDFEPFPFEEKALWTNASADWIRHVHQWELASENHWFDSVEDVPNLELLVIIAAHSESQLCLDYRQCGNSGTPAVTYIDVCMTPTEAIVVCPSVDEFIDALVAARPKSEGG